MQQTGLSSSSSNILSVPEIFTYEYFEQNRYSISEKDGYQALCNNGFIKLYTMRTRVYWHAQNQFQHRVPDWKFHVSVKHEDLRKAWDLLVGLFIKLRCRAGMKTIYLRQSIQPQNGREITIYIIKYSKQFESSSFANDYDVTIADEHSQDYWCEMIKQIQNILSSHSIQSNGLAHGDLKIGKYVSLRNQAYVIHQNGENGYPKNQKGWNAANHKLPINLSKFIKEIKTNQSLHGIPNQIQNKRPMYYFTMPIMLLTAGFYLYQKCKGTQL